MRRAAYALPAALATCLSIGCADALDPSAPVDRENVPEASSEATARARNLGSDPLVVAPAEELSALQVILEDVSTRLLPALEAGKRATALRAALDDLTKAGADADVAALTRTVEHARALLSQLEERDNGALAAEIGAVRLALEIGLELATRRDPPSTR